MRAAEVRAGMSREDLEECIGNDPDLVPLATRVLFAAGQGGDDGFRMLLGAALGDAVVGRDGSEDALLIVGLLESLRPAHMRVLKQLASDPPPSPLFEDTEARPFWVREQLLEAVGMSAEASDLCISELASRGAIVMGQTYRGNDCKLTSLGRTILDVLNSLHPNQSSAP